MGASIKIQDTNLDITKLECSQCQQSFTTQDKANQNWSLWFDTTGDDTDCLKIGGWWRLSVWVKDITHQAFPDGYNCPEREKEVSHA